jgi:head-tail adaptor
MIYAGDLTDKIVFSRVNNTQSYNGDLLNTDTDILTTFAKVEQKSGGYSIETGSVNSESRIDVMIRYRPDVEIRTGDRVKWRGFSWVIENSPIVDAWRTMIKFEATLKIEIAMR